MVVLPWPFSPISATRSPGSIRKFKSVKTGLTRPGYVKETLRNSKPLKTGRGALRALGRLRIWGPIEKNPGFVEGHTNRPDVDPLPSTLDSSYTFPGASPPLPSCTSGVGGAGIARAEYAWVIGPRGETNVALELLGQYTTCTESTGRVQPDTAQPIVRTQYWPHVGALVTWGFTWR